MPDVTIHELRSAFSHFSNHVMRIDRTPRTDQLCDRCRCLDLLYAIECGLKALVLQKPEYRIKDTSALDGQLRSHRLDLLLVECGLRTVRFPSIQLSNHPTGCKRILPHEFHEALRYGMKIPENQLKQLCDTIDNLHMQIERLIKGR